MIPTSERLAQQPPSSEPRVPGGPELPSVPPSPPASVRASPKSGNPPAGHDFALGTCTPCHVVAPDQKSPVRFADAPDFRAIARAPGTTQIGLNIWLTNPHPTMPKLWRSLPVRQFFRRLSAPNMIEEIRLQWNSLQEEPDSNRWSRLRGRSCSAHFLTLPGRTPRRIGSGTREPTACAPFSLPASISGKNLPDCRRGNALRQIKGAGGALTVVPGSFDAERH